MSPESDPELFNAAVVSLGMLGVITEVTLQCEDTFLLEETTVNHPIDYCISHYDELAHSAEFVKFWMEPNSKVCHVYLSNKTTKSPQNNRYRLVRNIVLQKSKIHSNFKSVTVGNAVSYEE